MEPLHLKATIKMLFEIWKLETRVEFEVLIYIIFDTKFKNRKETNISIPELAWITGYSGAEIEGAVDDLDRNGLIQASWDAIAGEKHTSFSLRFPFVNIVDEL